MNQHSTEELLDARQAAALLGVKLPTLYAYVSRGLLSSAAAQGGRQHRYARSELLRLKARAEARSGHGAVAAAALDFGEPVLESTLTEITADGPSYRGHAAVALACGDVAFESVAELLWSGELRTEPAWWPVLGRLAVAPTHLVRLLPAGSAPLTVLALLVPALAAQDPARFAAPPDFEKERAQKLLRSLGAGLCLGWQQELERVRTALSQPSLAGTVAVALLGAGARAERATPAINRALVLIADHELNMSTFAARIAASAGADLYACVSAALATLSGPRHGGACERIEALVAEAERAADPGQVVRERLRRGEAVPGFGHPLYPSGDPRTPPLLAAAEALGSRRSDVRALLAIIAAMRDSGHPPPSVDTGLVALALSLELLPGAAACLFAVGRAAGWVAHILEQRQSPTALRPRARHRR